MIDARVEPETSCITTIVALTFGVLSRWGYKIFGILLNKLMNFCYAFHYFIVDSVVRKKV